MATPAVSHTVTIGWTDNGNGTVTLWNEHWHGDQTFPCDEGILCSDNGGLTISGDGTSGSYGYDPLLIQWNGTLNDADRDDMLADGTLTGYMDDPSNAGGGTYDNWLYTQPLVIGNGTWYMFTGTTCCIDTMSEPIEFTLTGITSVGEGTGPSLDPPSNGGANVVPVPAGMPLLIGGLAALGLLRRRKAKA
ncbi:VPLPA-CTERM sorting domain-containing protein [Alphaproteobacteria bacterium GH1-50]|uniref:VPLPA-CTERM sorting domain-containing protein n=1 Tax=Kangsaoukella pontilimi TaxID=2691042 RepID=A0A7C9J552_9RHOB|nr:VPLPA-CTERM sorting domain-containing protein [Kangsaoukella pontilimi]MXQ09121.1 VPLPA-CTERM sorting domain-containing protein [Kangsaoukella pontilimi]